jgi:two-component sensor histidine kinase
MKLYLIICFSFFISFGQNIQSPTDSLKTILKTKKLSYQERVEILNKLAAEGGKFKSNFYNLQILNISKKYNYHKGLGYFFNNNALKAISGKNYYFINESSKNNILYDFRNAKSSLQKAKGHFLKIKDYNNYIYSIYIESHILGNQGKINAASQLLYKNIEIFKNRPSCDNIAELYYYVSLLNFVQWGNLKHSRIIFYYNKKALELYKKNKNDYGILKCYQLYLCYGITNKLYNSVEKNLVLCNEDLSKKFKLSSFYLQSINEVNAILSDELKQFKKALEYNKIVEKHIKKTNFEGVMSNYSEIALNYIHLKQYNNAKKYISLYEKQRIKHNSEDNLYMSYDLKAEFYFSIKDFKKAMYYRKLILNFYPDKSQSNIINKKSLAEIEFALRKYKQAYQHQNEYIDFVESQFDRYKKNQIAEFDALFQLDKKNQLINNSKLQNEKKEAELQKQKLFISALIISSLSLIIIFILTVLNFKNKQKSTRLIAVQNEELSSLNQLLQNSLNEKELLLKEIHHRVKNNLQLVMSLLNIQAADTNNTSIEEFLEKGRARISTIALIHQNLYLSESVSQIDFQNYLDNLTQQSKMSFGNENIEFEVEASQIKFDLDTAIPLGLIINELVTNSLKHAFPNDINGKIVIAIESKNENQYQISVSDNGIGMVKKAVSSTKSIGMELVHLLVMQLNGSIEKINTVGTHYFIKFQFNPTN